MGRGIVILALQYSVIVKGMERKLKDEGYFTTMISDDFLQIRELSGISTDLFLLYLPGDVADNADVMSKLTYICDIVRQRENKMLMIGEQKDHSELNRKMPSTLDIPWVNRPLDMVALVSAIEDVLEGRPLPGQKKRILIVDDDPSYAKMIREWIKDDFQADIVTAGMQAITFLLKNPVNMILLDYEMPVVDGPQVLQMLRQEPATAKIPVIFLTGIGTKEAVQRVMSLKPDGYILKTTTRDNLLEFLHSKL